MPKYPDGMDRRRQIRLPRAMDDGLVALARERGVTVSDLIRYAVARVFLLPDTGTLTTTEGTETTNEEGKE